MENNNNNEIKAIIIGSSGVGKTNLMNTCAGDDFNPNSTSNMNCTFRQVSFNIKNKNYIINLWDTAGQEVYKSISKIFYKKAEIVIFVFDITKKKSLIEIDDWIKIVKEELGNNFICGLIGNKIDLFLDQKVSEEEAKEFAKKRGMQCQLVSAKTSPNKFKEFLKKLITEPISVNKLKDPKDNDKRDSKSSITLLTRKRGNSIKLESGKNGKNDNSFEKEKKCCF